MILLVLVCLCSAFKLPPSKELFFSQQVDHFSWGRGQYQQRFFLFDGWYEIGGPIFFYVGNEAAVDLYVNNTGLMWENAASFKGEVGLLFFVLVL
jgi:hypothetical protein